MIVAEALYSGTIVMSSKNTPWQELNEYNCGWWQSCEPEDMANIMNIVIKMSEEELSVMGNNGISLIEERYMTKHVAEKMNSLYNWLLENNVKPEFIF